jgi:D-alanyl-lipoteichoic acid acyltransferase DltB (MBOAT superfamily)
MATMLIGGLWHGAAWNFVLWGGYQGLLLIMTRRRTEHAVSPGPAWRWLGSIGTFVLMLYGWLLFRARGMDQLAALHRGLFSGLSSYDFLYALVRMLPYIGLVLAVDTVTFRTKDPLFFAKLPPILTALFYIFLLYAILLFGVTAGGEFIYFAF